MICIAHQPLFRQSNQGGQNGQDMWHAWGRREVHARFGVETCRQETTWKIYALMGEQRLD